MQCFHWMILEYEYNYPTRKFYEHKSSKNDLTVIR